MNNENSFGYLVVNVYIDNIAQPLENAKVRIIGEDTDITLLTNSSGETEKVKLKTPNISASLNKESDVRPYSIYTVIVTFEGAQTARYEGVEVYPNETSRQDIYLTSEQESLEKENIVKIDPPTLWQDYPASLNEESDDGGITPFVLKRVVVPRNIIVHDGIPSNKNASDYTVTFTDYIKNVACSEIYSTWPVEAIRANVLAIISFTLNRIYTEWYLSKGYDFTVTSTTTYDQKWTKGRTIFDSISNVVDEIFTTYIKPIGLSQPLLAHYQATTNEAGYLSQWGSKYLADQGYNALDIIKYYYGNVELSNAQVSEEYPFSYSGTSLKEGDCSEEVQVIQNQLNFIRGSYPKIPRINDTNGYFGEDTVNAVKTFQEIFALYQTGVVNFATWYKISYIYVSVKDMLKSIY